MQAMDLMTRMYTNHNSNWNNLKAELADFIVSCKAKDLTDLITLGLIENLEAQVSETMVKEKYMQKWGEHQLRQLVRALNMQIKNNFRDPAVQHFGGKKFHEFADIADDIYNSMPTPTPSRKS